MPEGNATYDAFVSYSHAADGKLAPALRAGLHRFARPWYRLRALHVFQDQANLAVSPHLWSSITAAMDRAAWFILLASPGAAASKWVDREIEHWLQRQSPDRILMVLTEGTATWTPDRRAFDPASSSAVPPRLQGAFPDEPLYLDLTWARAETHLSLAHPRFRDAVAQLAAAIGGRSKEELIGEDVRQFRRTRRLAWTAAAALAILTVSSSVAAWFAVRQRDVAREQRARAVRQSEVALAGRLAAESRAGMAGAANQLPLATLLAVESTRVLAGSDGNAALRATLSLLPRPAVSYVSGGSYDNRVRALAVSPDGRWLGAGRDDGSLDLLPTSSGAAAVALPPNQNPGGIVELPGGGFRWTSGENEARIVSVAFSADSHLVAAADRVGAAHVWEISSRRALQTLGAGAGVVSVAFSPSGAQLATGSCDKMARLWDLATGGELVRVEHGEEVREVAFSPDGRLLGAVSTSGGISLIDVAAKQVLRHWSFGDAGLSLAFSASSTRMATASGQEVAVWDVGDQKLLFKATHRTPLELGYLNYVDDVALSPDGALLASAGRDGTARVWDVAGGQELLRLAHAAPVSAVAFNPEGTLLGTASADGSARLWDLKSGTEQLRAAHRGELEAVTFSPDGRLVASADARGDLEMWSLSRGDQLARLALDRDVESVAMSPDDRLIATSSHGGIRVWSGRGEPRPSRLKLPVVRVDRMVFSPDGTHLAALWSSSLFAIDLAAEGRDMTFTRLGDRWSTQAAIGARYLASHDREARAITIREIDGRPVTSIPCEDADTLRFDPTGRILAANVTGPGREHAVQAWTLPEGRSLGRIATKGTETFAVGPPAGAGTAGAGGARRAGPLVALSTGERDAASGKYAFFVDVLEVATSRRITRVPVAGETSSVFDATNERLALVAGDQVRVVDLATLRPGPPLRGDELRGVRFSPERNVVATLSARTIRFWRGDTGELLSEITSDRGFSDARFTSDGRHFLTGAADGGAVLWLWKTEDLRDEACRRLSRNLTGDEWARYVGDAPYRRSCPNLPGASRDEPP